jgi:hypothetical protein
MIESRGEVRLFTENENEKNLAASRLRALGGWETLSWLLDQNRPAHFAMVAEVLTHRDVEAWRSALLAAQRKHPLLSARIRNDPVAGVGFYHVANAPIPLRVVPRARSSWQFEAAKELGMPFDYGNAPLIRAVLLRDEDGATLVLAAHHSVADAMGLTFLITDILRALDGGRLAPLDLAFPLERLLDAEVRKYVPEPVTVSPTPVTPKAFRPVEVIEPTVDAMALTPELTASLVKRSRKEKTTVHGAIGAAVHEAGRRFMPEWCERPVRMATPFDLRGLADEAQTAAGVYAMSAVTSHEHPRGAPFWDLARAIKINIEPFQTKDATLAHLKNMQDFVASQPDARTVATLATQVFAFDVTLSNLGNLPIESNYGSVKLEAIWGPLINATLSGVQVIGVATLDGVLRLAHTSYAPVVGWLDTIHELLAAAVSER